MVQFWQMLEDDNGQSKFLNFKEWNWYFFSLIENAESTMIVLGFIFWQIMAKYVEHPSLFPDPLNWPCNFGYVLNRICFVSSSSEKNL